MELERPENRYTHDYMMDFGRGVIVFYMREPLELVQAEKIHFPLRPASDKKLANLGEKGEAFCRHVFHPVNPIKGVAAISVSAYQIDVHLAPSYKEQEIFRLVAILFAKTFCDSRMSQIFNIPSWRRARAKLKLVHPPKEPKKWTFELEDRTLFLARTTMLGRWVRGACIELMDFDDMRGKDYCINRGYNRKGMSHRYLADEAEFQQVLARENELYEQAMEEYRVKLREYQELLGHVMSF